jgi:allantoinase
MFNPASFPDRHLSMEGIYEYGSRVGVWRLLREFEKRGLPLTVFGVGMALQRHPELTAAFVELGHEIACHGWRWISYQNIDEATEREHMRLGMEAIERPHRRAAPGLVHRARQPQHARLVADDGGFEYDSDYYGDDLPFWMKVRAPTAPRWYPQLVVPYTLDTNDMRFALPQGFPTPTRSSSTCATASMHCTPKARHTPDAEHRHALPPAGPPGTNRGAAALLGPYRHA